MKKAFCVFAAVIFMLAAGCEKQENAIQTSPPFPDSFVTHMEAKFGEAEMTAELTRSGEEDYTIKFITPEAISPLTLFYKDGICTVSFNEISFEADSGRFPQAEMGALIAHSISDTIKGIDVSFTCSDGTCTYSGSGERGAFTLTSDEESRALQSLTVEGADLYVTFSEFKEK